MDNRGRTNFPAPFRHALSRGSKDRVVVAPGLDDCLFVFPRDGWISMQSDFDTPYIDEKLRIVQRHLFYETRELGFDSQGRITIPPSLLQLANIEKEVKIIGMNTWIEIWNPRTYIEFLKKTNQDKKTILEGYFAHKRLLSEGNSSGKNTSSSGQGSQG